MGFEYVLMTMIVAIISKIQVTTYTSDEFNALPQIEKIRAKLNNFEKIEEVVIGRVAIENAEEMRNWISQTCDKTQGAIIVYLGDAFKDRFLFNEGYDESLKTGMAEAIVFQDISIRPPRGPGLPPGTVYIGTDKLMQNPAGILGPSSSIICRVFGKNPAEFQKTYESLYRLSNISKLQLLNSTVLGGISTITNRIHEAHRSSGSTNPELERSIKELEAKYPQGMTDSQIEQHLMSSLRENEQTYREAVRKSFEAQFRKNPKVFCENAKKFDVEAIITQMRIQAGWIQTDRPQPLRISDITNRFHLRIVKEEIDKLCQQGDESAQND